jgi:hypothetical protein
MSHGDVHKLTQGEIEVYSQVTTDLLL